MDVCLIWMEKLCLRRIRVCRYGYQSADRKIKSIEKIKPRMIVATFYGNPSTSIFPATALQMLVIKRTSTPSRTSYPPFFVATQNTAF